MSRKTVLAAFTGNNQYNGFQVEQSLTPLNEPEKALGRLFMIVPVLLVFVFAQKYIVQGLAAGAVKE